LPGIESVSIVAGDQLLHLNIVWRPQRPYGGFRPFLECSHCAKWATILYLAPHLACRSCHRLAYESENLTPLWRKRQKLQRLRERAGCDTSRLPVLIPLKPKWQRWHTYLRLQQEIQDADADFASAFLRGRRRG
jgi:hypothetical protein